MAVNTLLLTGLATFSVALVYAYVGLRLPGRKATTEPAGRAMAFFSMWWLATAANQVAGAALYVAASMGWTSLDVQLAYTILQRLLLAASLVGLMYYLLYVFRGRGYLVPLVVFYATFAVVSIYSVLAGRPDGIWVGRWRTELDHTVEVSPLFALANLVFIVLPPVAGSLALWRLYPRVETRGQRFRIAAVSIGFVVWWVVAVAAGNRGALDHDAIQIVNRVLTVSVALVILSAYAPGAWLQRRFGVEPYHAGAA